ncbi:MAG: proline--tRNA ligase [Chloroflexi bacterium]|nr:proline--tRNA ligase [Chloroflexota bacterium]
MRLSQLFGKTLRQPPAEAETVSHQLLVRAGMIHQVAAGVYSYLPLGWRALRKIEQIIREEMDAAGGQELNMPVLQPLELWQETGRDKALGDTLFTLKDRRQRPLVLGPTHEEVITLLARQNVRSYRDLPLLLYQIQTKFRDEPRPRGGLIRVREFPMKDLYSFDVDEAGLNLSYRKMAEAYRRIFQRCGLPTLMVEADSGAIGGKGSHEFMVIAPTGENEVLTCEACGYAANAERAAFAKSPLPPEEPMPLEEVPTPGAATIAQVAGFLGVPPSQTYKAVFHWCDGAPVLVTIRGDLEVNEVKLKNALKCAELRLATEREVLAAGLVAGYASPVGLKGIKTVADDSITTGANFVAGANREGYHLKQVNYPRDFSVDLLTDIAQAQAGLPCPQCRAPLRSTRGIEVGHVFKLGAVYSQKLGANFLDQEGRQRPMVMGCYGIGVGRLLAAAVEQNHDGAGIIWPSPIAPYQVHLVGLGMDKGEVAASAAELYSRLQAGGFEVLFDDRLESPGVKFNDADLLGLPVRLTISARTIKAQGAELKRRRDAGPGATVPLAGLLAEIKSLLAGEGQQA